MINRELFDEKLREISGLMGQPIKKDTVAKIYERIGNANVNDFIQAVNSFLEVESKFNFFSLKKHMDNAYLARMDREYEIEKEHRKIDAKKFWSENYKDGACSRKCKLCPAIACGPIALLSIKTIKSLLNDEISKDKAQNNLISAFPDAGFENHTMQSGESRRRLLKRYTIQFLTVNKIDRDMLIKAFKKPID